MSLFETLDPNRPKHPPIRPELPSVDVANKFDAMAEFLPHVQTLMDIEKAEALETLHRRGLWFRGTLTQSPTAVYKHLTNVGDLYGYTVYLERDSGRDEIMLAEGLIPERNFTLPWLIHLSLFLSTIFTTMISGAILRGYTWNEIMIAINEGNAVKLNDIYSAGITFSLPLMTILLAQEIGRFMMARWYGVKITLPFFIPLPIFGTLGTLGGVAFIKTPFRNRRILFDIGLAGALTGLVVALGVFLWGLNMPTTEGIPRQWIIELRLNRVTMPPLLEWVAALTWDETRTATMDRSIFYNYPQALAGWFGLMLITLRLLPIGQFDGGNMATALVGRRMAMFLAALTAIVCILIGLTSFWIAWLLWPIIAVMTGLQHPKLNDEITPLGWPRILLGLIMLGLLATMIVVTPFYSTLR